MKVFVSDADLPNRDDVVTVSSIDEAAEALDATRGRDVLLVAGPDALEHRARVARMALARGDVGLVVLDGYRTARTLLAAVLLDLPAGRYGAAPELLAHAAARVRTRLALTSVSRLADPVPTLRQHVRGWLPSTVFDVDVTAREVHETREVTWTAGPDDFQVWAASAEPRRLRVTVDGPAPALTLPSSSVPPPWRAREWAEASSFDRAPERVLAELLDTLSPRSCPMCHRVAAGARCIFCGHVLPHHQGESSPMTSANVRAGAAG